MTAKRVHFLKMIAGNVGFVASYWLFPASYRFYRTQKLLFNAVFCCETPVLANPKYERQTVIIDGFRHSGNCFITSNVTTDHQGRLPQERHKVWTLKWAIKHRLPVVVLVRNPSDVALSTIYRTTTYSYVPFRIAASAVLLAWIGYHLFVLRQRQSLTILPFETVAKNYDTTCKIIEGATGVLMNRDPIWTKVHRYGGVRWEVRQSWLSEILLRQAELIYCKLMHPNPSPFSDKSVQPILSPALPTAS